MPTTPDLSLPLLMQLLTRPTSDTGGSQYLPPLPAPEALSVQGRVAQQGPSFPFDFGFSPPGTYQPPAGTAQAYSDAAAASAAVPSVQPGEISPPADPRLGVGATPGSVQPSELSPPALGSDQRLPPSLLESLLTAGSDIGGVIGRRTESANQTGAAILDWLRQTAAPGSAMATGTPYSQPAVPADPAVPTVPGAGTAPAPVATPPTPARPVPGAATGGLPQPPPYTPIRAPDQSLMQRYLEQLVPQRVTRSSEDQAKDALMAGLAAFGENPGVRLGNIVVIMAGAGWGQAVRGRQAETQRQSDYERQRQGAAGTGLSAALGLQNQDLQVQQANQSGQSQDFRNRLAVWNTLALLQRAQQGGSALGSGVQTAVLQGLTAPYMARARQQLEAMVGGPTQLQVLESTQGAAINQRLQALAMREMMNDPNGMANFQRVMPWLRHPTNGSLNTQTAE